MEATAPLAPPVDLSHRPSWLKQAVHRPFLLQAPCTVLETFSHNRYSSLQLAEDTANTFPPLPVPDYTTKKCFFSFLKSLLSLAQPRESK